MQPRLFSPLPLPLMLEGTTEDNGVRQDGYAVGTRRNYLRTSVYVTVAEFD